MPLKSASAWIITDGKAGDEQQCIGVSKELGVIYKKIHVKPHWLYSLLMPYGSIDPKDDPTLSTSSIAPPFPDIAIASGRRAVAYLKKIKNASQGRCFTVFLKNPRARHKIADFIWTPEHDGIKGENILTTLTSPHTITELALQTAAKNSRFTHISSPKIAVLLGGDSSLYQFTDKNCSALTNILSHLAESGAGLMISPSRRTPKLLRDAIKNINGFLWDGEGKNPLIEMFSAADHIIVTADSVNMVGEAVSTGKPVHVFYPAKRFKLLKFKPHKIECFLNRLTDLGAIKPLEKTLKSWTYEPINSTPVIAAEIKKRYRDFRSALSGEKIP